MKRSRRKKNSQLFESVQKRGSFMLENGGDEQKTTTFNDFPQRILTRRACNERVKKSNLSRFLLLALLLYPKIQEAIRLFSSGFYENDYKIDVRINQNFIFSNPSV
jgi:hypothetical protein